MSMYEATAAARPESMSIRGDSGATLASTDQAPINAGLDYARSEMDRVHHQIDRLRTRLEPISQPHDNRPLSDSLQPERPRSEITQIVFSLGGSAGDAAEKIIEILNYLDL